MADAAKRARGADPAGLPWSARTVLRLADLFRAPITAAGVDFPQLRALIELRLTIDSRRGDGQEGGFRYFGAVFRGGLLAIFGLATGVGGTQLNDPSHYTSLTASVLFFLGTVSVAAFLVDQLFDASIDTLLAPRPVIDATAMAARVAIVACDVLLICAPFALPTIVIGAFRYGVFPFLPAYTVACVLVSLLGTSLLVLFFGVAMRTMSVERFKRVVTYVQIAFAMAGMIVPQFLGRLVDAKHLSAGFDALALLYPPIWFGRAVAFAHGSHDAVTLIGAALSIVVPFGALVVAFRLLENRFIAAQLAPASMRAARSTSFSPPVARLARRFTRDREELAGAELALALTGRERGLMMRILPQLAFPVMMTISLLFRPHRAGVAAGVDTWWWIAVDFCAFVAPNVVFNARFSENPEAAWTLDAAPVSGRRRVLVGALRAMLARFVIGPGVIVTAVIAAFTGPLGLVDGLTALALVTSEVVSITRATTHRAPFAQPYSKDSAADLTGLGLMHMLGIGLVIGVQAIGQFWSPWRWVLPVLAIPLAIVMWRSLDDVEVAGSPSRSSL